MIVYWLAKTQFELGEDESVANTAKTYPPNGVIALAAVQWIDSILYLGAVSRARLGDYVMAQQLLASEPVLQSHGTSYLIRRWGRLAQGASEEERPVPSENEQ